MGDDVELPTVAAGRDSDESLEAVESPPSLSPEAADFAEREGGQQQASEGAAAPSPAKSHSKAKKRGKKSKRYKKESSTSCDLVSSTGGGPVKGRGPGWGALAALAIGTAVTACAAAFIFPRRKWRLWTSRDRGAFARRFAVMPAGDGPLTGLRFACKDNMAVAGQILTNGCHAWSEMKTSGRPAPQTAPCVMSALRAGAELVGHTVMDQLAYSLQGNESDFPTPTNPRHPSLLPGGSSSGSAVAVASGEVDFALGTDTAGSVRIPAACCGVLGIRTTHGLINTDGVVALSRSLDTVGWFAKDADTLRRVGKALLPESVSWEVKLPRNVFYSVDLFEFLSGHPDDTSAMALGAFKAVLDKIAASGMDPVPIQMVDLPMYIQAHCPSLSAYMTLMPENEPRAVRVLGALSKASQQLQAYEVGREHRELLERHGNRLQPGVRARLQACVKMTEANYQDAKKVQGEFKHAMAEAFKSSPSAVFVIPTSPFPLLPTKPSMDALVGYRDRVTSLTCVAGMAGLPQVVVPMGTDMQGHEVTVSLVGSPGGDGLLLEMAGMLHGRLRQAWEVVKGHVKEEKRKMAEGEKKAHAKQAREEADKEKARKLKDKGNEAFRGGRYAEATRLYTESIASWPGEATVYSNRAAALLKQMRFAEAEADCNRALELGRDFNVKTLLRRGAAREGLQDYDGAEKDYKHVLQQEPGNRDARAGLTSIAKAREAAASMGMVAGA